MLIEKITKEMFLSYEKVRESGVCNMLDLRKVSSLSGLEKDEIKIIILNYPELKKKYLEGK